MRDANGPARSRAWNAVATGSVLGLSEMRPSFLVHVSAARRKAEGAGRLAVLISSVTTMPGSDPDDLDEDDGYDEDDDETEQDDDEDDDEDGDEEDDVETWQVVSFRRFG
jgi:hypothetical protein